MPSSPRIALITGANRGIGRATALALARDGVDAIITYRSHADEADGVGEEILALGGDAIAFRLDTSDTASFGSFASALAGALQERWGRESFDFLINNAGMQITPSRRRWANAESL